MQQSESDNQPSYSKASGKRKAIGLASLGPAWICIMLLWTAAIAGFGLHSFFLKALLEARDRPHFAGHLIEAALVTLAGAVTLRLIDWEKNTARSKQILLVSVLVLLISWISVNAIGWSTTSLFQATQSTAIVAGVWMLAVLIARLYANHAKQVAWFARGLLVLTIPLLAYLTGVDDPERVPMPLREWVFMNVNGRDTLVHIVVACGLTVMLVLAGPVKTGRGFWCVVCVATMLAVGPAVEVLQERIGRGKEVSDAIGHAIGTSLGLLLVFSIWLITAWIKNAKTR